MTTLAAACLAAWAVHDRAGPQPTGSAKAHATAMLGHHSGAQAYVPPPPVTADAPAHLLGLAMLVVLPAALVVTAARRLTRGRGAVAFAALAAVGAAVLAALAAVLTLGPSVADDGALGAAGVVARGTFVVAAVCAVVPFHRGRKYLR